MENQPLTLATASLGRRNNLDFIRYIFAAMVIFSHSLIFDTWFHQDYFGWIAVNGFFLISGFLITASWVATPVPKTYLTKRFLRIYPGYVFMVVVTTAIFTMLSLPLSREYFHSLSPPIFLAKTLLFLTPAKYGLLTRFASQPHSNLLNLSVWTLPYELICYVMVAVLGMLGQVQKRRNILIFFAVVWLFTAVQDAVAPDFWATHKLLGHSIDKLNQLPRLLTFFLTGMTFYLYREKIPLTPKGFAIAAPITVACFVVPHLLWLVPPFITYTLFCFGFTNTLKCQNFARYGDMSYGVFLWGWPVQKLIEFFWGAHLTPYRLFPWALLAASGCALVSWHLVEKPALKLKGFAKRVGAPHLAASATQDLPASAG